MRSRRPFRLATLALISCLSACIDGGEDDTTDSSTDDLYWFMTCGDPVCQGYTGPFPDVPLCTDETLGDACLRDGDQCDPENECNALMICATEGPAPEDCPISRAKYKKDINYLSDKEVESLHKDVMDMRLATWQYRTESISEREHLGFIIDDQPTSPAVKSDGEHVDLYGYTSMTVAALQQQAKQIEALQAEVQALRTALESAERTASCETKTEVQP